MQEKQDYSYMHETESPEQIVKVMSEKSSSVALRVGDKQKLKKKYEKLKSLFEKLVDEIAYQLQKSIEKKDIKIQSLTARSTKVKTFESFYDKIVRKQVKSDPFKAIEDIAGVRVVCLYRSDLGRLGDLIFEEFRVVRADTSRTQTGTPFGYSSDHYIIKLSKKCRGPRYDDIKELKCEIQVRTLLMDAWASVSHHLEYKQELDIPRDLRRDFDALAGLFYVADTHFEIFKDGIIESRKSLLKTVQLGKFSLDQEINLDSLTAYMQLKFPERGIEGVGSTIIKELATRGYQSIRQLDDKVSVALPIMKELEMEQFDQEEWAPKWASSGTIRVILDLTDDEYVKRHGSALTLARADAKTTFGRYMFSLKKYRSKLR